jgi:hypothetical protein
VGLLTAWKDLERRVARALGGERSGPLGRNSSDATGTSFAVECKRTTRYSLRRPWIDQARRQAKQEGRPWLLVISEHNDRRPIVVLDFWAFAQIAQDAGLIPSPLLVEEDGAA